MERGAHGFLPLVWFPVCGGGGLSEVKQVACAKFILFNLNAAARRYVCVCAHMNVCPEQFDILCSSEN